MKKKISSIVLACILLLSASALVTAQTYDCIPGNRTETLYNNAVRTDIQNGGSMFVDNYRVGQLNARVLYNSALWLSAKDSMGQFRTAACTYRNRGNDFYPGPINMVTRETDRWQCRDWDKIFSVSSCEVTRVVDDFNDNGRLDVTPSLSVLTWPGQGNPHFDSLVGFQLPNQ